MRLSDIFEDIKKIYPDATLNNPSMGYCIEFNDGFIQEDLHILCKPEEFVIVFNPTSFCERMNGFSNCVKLLEYLIKQVEEK